MRQLFTRTTLHSADSFARWTATFILTVALGATIFLTQTIAYAQTDTTKVYFKSSLKGQVIDHILKKPIEGAEVKLFGSDNSVVAIKTDSSGKYFFDNQYIKANTNYIVSASGLEAKNKYRQGFLGNPKAKFSTKDSIKSANFIQNFELKAFGSCVDYVPLVLFSKNSSVLENNSKDSLNLIARIMTENPNIVFELAGHSNYDERRPNKLAMKRAISVMDYLISKGIEKERFEFKSYGKKKPFVALYGNEMNKEEINKAKSKEEKEKLMNLNRRVGFILTRKDYPVK